MHFDWTITLGSVLVAIGIAVSAIGITGSVIWATFKLIAEISAWKTAVNDRLNTHDKWIEGHEECNKRILKYMEDNSAKLSVLSGDVSYLRGMAEGRNEHGAPQLKERY